MENKKLKHLGKIHKNFDEPDFSILEKIKNPHCDREYCIRFTCPEFTSICPVTSQPDFAHIIIDYIPNKYIVESKSLKLFLQSFRNHGSFHEDCSIYIAKSLENLLKPKWIRIGGYWFPRGGMPIDIFYQSSNPPKNVWIKEQPQYDYHGR